MFSRIRRFICWTAFFSALGTVCAHADNAQFDLQGPTLEVKVQRDGRTLPIGEVPTLQPGDRLWLHPVLGEHESVHFLMVAVFLRGSTNPPPDQWFTKVEAWNKQVMEEGIYLVVPPGADQAVVLFAPQTGGDYSTLKSAVRGRPGAFVRATQDLNLASIDRARINAYLASVRSITDPDKVKAVSNTLARSLSLKINQDCFQRPSDQQAACLQQSQSALILANGSSSVTQGLLNGPTSDLALQAGYTPGMAAGLYDPYIAVALDIGKILASFHSAQYQYIPALSSDEGLDMDLWLNAPPSFHNPKSVMVVALPPIHKAQPPALHPVDPKQLFCMQKTPLILPVDGAPEVFATQFAHGLTLHLKGKSDKAIDLPTHPEAGEGGFVVPALVLKNADLGDEVEATVQGYWGFDAYKGPSFKLDSTGAGDWTVADTDKSALVVGRDDQIHLHSPAAACVQEVTFVDASGKEAKATWKPDGQQGITATLPLKETAPGNVIVSIKQYGLPSPKTLSIPSFAEVGKYDAFTIHAGDNNGLLSGTRLDQVAGLVVRGIQFKPGKLSRNGDKDSLLLTAEENGKKPADGAVSPITGLGAGVQTIAQITLKDGRVVPVEATVTEPRPTVSLINKNVESPAPPSGATPIAFKLGAPDELPLNGKMTFALRSESPATFAKGESIEIATDDGMASVTYNLGSGELMLQDAKTAIATLDPQKSFGTSAFGPLHLRAILADGTTGDWTPLATLVRLPTLDAYTCGTDPGAGGDSCTLKGSGMFLLAAVAPSAAFAKPVQVPDGFAGDTLEVPRVPDGQLFARLRDDPAVVNTVTVPPPPVRVARRAHRPMPGDGAAPPADAAAPASDATQDVPPSATAGAAAPAAKTAPPAPGAAALPAPPAGSDPGKNPAPAKAAPAPATPPASPTTPQ